MVPPTPAARRPHDSGLLARLQGELELELPPSMQTGAAASAARVPLPSRLAVAELSWSCVAVAGGALSPDGWEDPDPVLVAASYRSHDHQTVDGRRPEAFAPLSGFWRTVDGWVRTHGNYPHHAAAMLTALELPADAGAAEVGSALRRMSSHAAASAIGSAGGVCVPVRKEDPSADAALRRHPLIEVTRLAGSAPCPLPRPTAAAPLHGVRVLDLTRVIAGPVATRTLALAGADVLRIDPPQLPEIPSQHLDTGHGKRSALLDVAAEPSLFDALVGAADVIVLGYRPQALSRLGLDPERLARRHPHLVVAQLSAWPGGSGSRGFDSIVQAECGISWADSDDGTVPGALPAQALDHSAGYLVAAGVATALRRRAESGGSWLVRTSLRRVAAELLGMPRSAARTPESPEAAAAPPMQSFDVAGVRVTTVAPAVRWPGSPRLFAPPRPWGGDVAAW